MFFMVFWVSLDTLPSHRPAQVAVNAAAAVPIDVMSFQTEMGFDKLYVDCKAGREAVVRGDPQLGWLGGLFGFWR